MLEWWLDLPPLLRAGIAVLILGIAALVFFVGDRFWPFAWGLGAVLLLFSFPSGSNKGGYRNY